MFVLPGVVRRRCGLVALLALAACTNEERRCEQLSGDFLFVPRYSRVSGSCGEPCEPMPSEAWPGCLEELDFDANLGSGPVLPLTIRTHDVVASHAAPSGDCELGVRQTVRLAERLKAQVDATVEIINQDELRGTATAQLWDENGSQVCEGEYELVLVRRAAAGLAAH